MQKQNWELSQIIQKLERTEPCPPYFLPSCTAWLSDKIPKIVVSLLSCQLIFISLADPKFGDIQRFLRQPVEFLFSSYGRGWTFRWA
jgi:hypothetical protein